MSEKQIKQTGPDYELVILDDKNLAVDMFVDGKPAGKWSRVFLISEPEAAHAFGRSECGRYIR